MDTPSGTVPSTSPLHSPPPPVAPGYRQLSLSRPPVVVSPLTPSPILSTNTMRPPLTPNKLLISPFAGVPQKSMPVLPQQSGTDTPPSYTPFGQRVTTQLSLPGLSPSVQTYQSMMSGQPPPIVKRPPPSISRTPQPLMLPGMSSPVVMVPHYYRSRGVSSLPALPPMTVEEIKLLESQIAPFAKMEEISRWSHFILNTSPPRCGKTFMAGAYAKKYGFRMLVICESKLIDTVWNPFIRRYGVDCVGVIALSSMAGTGDSQPKHGLLEKIVTRTGDIREVRYAPTNALLELAAGGLLVVVDECVHIKNSTAQSTRACAALISGVFTAATTHNRIMLLSGTPIDEETQCVTFMRNVGYFTTRNLYHAIDGMPQLDGIAQIRDNVRGMLDSCHGVATDQGDTALQAQVMEAINVLDQLVNTFGNTPTNSRSPMIARKLVYDIVVRILIPFISVSVSRPVSSKIPYAAFFPLDAASTATYKERTELIARQVKYDPVTGRAQQNISGKGKSSMFALMKENDLACLPAYVKHTRYLLRKDPHCKVVCCVTSPDHAVLLAADLAAYNPVVCTGKVKIKDRPAVYQRFQDDTDECRVFIGTIQVMCEGVALHDTSGSRPRYILIRPTFSINSIHQASERSNHISELSPNTVYLVYVEGVELERKIVNALIRKSKVYKDILPQQVADGVVYPGDYPVWRPSDEGIVYPEDEGTAYMLSAAPPTPQPQTPPHAYQAPPPNFPTPLLLPSPQYQVPPGVTPQLPQIVHITPSPRYQAQMPPPVLLTPPVQQRQFPPPLQQPVLLTPSRQPPQPVQFPPLPHPPRAPH